MMSPLKLSVIVCGAAAGLAVAPYVVKQILPPDAQTEIAADTLSAPSDVNSAVKADLPVAGTNTVSDASPALALAAPVKEESPTRPELHLAAPALPAPHSAPRSQGLTLPSLSNPQVAAAVPSPTITKTPVPAPSPTPEIPFRSEVKTAQTLMKDLGLSTGKIDGKLGPNTMAAVQKFQENHDLKPTGEVDTNLISKMQVAVEALATPIPKSAVEITDSDAKKDADKAKSGDDTNPADDLNAIIVRKNDDAKTQIASLEPKVDPGPVPTLKNMKDVRKLQEELKEAGTYSGDVDGKWGDLTRAAMRDFQKKVDIEVTGKPNKETWIAMHRDERAFEKKASSRADSTADEMEISQAESEPSNSDKNEELVVNLNADGISDPANKSPIPTPAAVSALKRKRDSDETAAVKDDAIPKVKVSTPEKDSDSSDSASEDKDKPNDLAVAEVDHDAQLEKFRKLIDEKRAKIKSVSNDSTYEVKKYAPRMLETVNNMVDDLKIDSVSNDPAEAKEQLAKIDEELEKAKSESIKKKAGETVDGVRKSYHKLKDNFPDRIKALSLKDDDQKKEREDLTELVARVDLGFEQMEKDYNAGNYDPIFKNGQDFSTTINRINRQVADDYVSAKLEDKSVKKKLNDDDLEQIKKLQKDDEHLKAADVLDKVVADKDN